MFLFLVGECRRIEGNNEAIWIVKTIEKTAKGLSSGGVLGKVAVPFPLFSFFASRALRGGDSRFAFGRVASVAGGGSPNPTRIQWRRLGPIDHNFAESGRKRRFLRLAPQR